MELKHLTDLPHSMYWNVYFYYYTRNIHNDKNLLFLITILNEFIFNIAAILDIVIKRRENIVWECCLFELETIITVRVDSTTLGILGGL